jgi:hypothetical protein
MRIRYAEAYCRLRQRSAEVSNGGFDLMHPGDPRWELVRENISVQFSNALALGQQLLSLKPSSIRVNLQICNCWAPFVMLGSQINFTHTLDVVVHCAKGFMVTLVDSMLRLLGMFCT